MKQSLFAKILSFSKLKNTSKICTLETMKQQRWNGF